MSEAEGTTRRRNLQAAAAAAAMPALGGAAGAAEAKPDLVGVWRLVGGSITDDRGERRGIPYGPRGTGLVSLSADGRMMAVLVDARDPGSSGERREYASYCGTYTVEDGVLTTTTYAFSDEARFGPPQVRRVRMEGERLVLVPPSSRIGDRTVTRELVWERISTVSL